MALTIISETYGARKPLVICEADSLDDLVGLKCAEGSEATIDGKRYVLDRVNGWVDAAAPAASNTFLVTLTPTAEDLSGTMDKQPSEIRVAYDAGKLIRFSVPEMHAAFEMTSCTLYDDYVAADDSLYNSIAAAAIFWYNVGGQDVLINVLTNEADQEVPYYNTMIFPLTPMENL